MRLVVVIFGLLSALSAQVICHPVDTKGSVDWHLFDSKTVAVCDVEPRLRTYWITKRSSRLERCFERVQGTFGLNNGKVVHSLWIELKPLERWASDSGSCSATQFQEPLYTFVKGIRERRQDETKMKRVTIPNEFCRATDH